MPNLFSRILVPYDFSPHAARVLRVAMDLAVAHDGQIVVLHALPPVYPIVGLPPLALRKTFPPPAEGPKIVRRVRDRLEALVAREAARRRTAGVECRVVIADAFEAIMQAARGASVIVMGTVGRSGVPHLVIGSVAEKVVRHSAIPVLTVRPRKGRSSRSRRGG